jgi:RPA family protein
MRMVDIKRQTAYKCTIKTILNNPYIHKEGWEPSYIQVNTNQVSRVNILATIVSKDENSFTIDDGTAKIQVMLFTEPQRADNLNVGDVILIIARPREYNNKKFVVPEIMRKITEPKWIEYRKKELQLSGESEIQVEEQNIELANLGEEEFKMMKPVENYSAIMLSLIKKLDKGEGSDTEQVIKQSRLKDADKIITTL